jgi:hypothetical protein
MLPANVCFWYSCQIWQIPFLYIVSTGYCVAKHDEKVEWLKITSDIYSLSFFSSLGIGCYSDWRLQAGFREDQDQEGLSLRRVLHQGRKVYRCWVYRYDKLMILCNVDFFFFNLNLLRLYRWSRIELRVIFGQAEDYRRQRWEGMSLWSLWLWIHSSVSGNSRGVYEKYFLYLISQCVNMY